MLKIHTPTSLKCPHFLFCFNSLLLFILLVLMLPQLAAAQAVVPLAVLSDTDGNESINTVAAPERSKDFRPIKGSFSAGYTRQVHWLRLELTPPDGRAGQAFLMIQPPFLDDVRLYLPQDYVHGGFLEKHAGDREPFAEREVEHRGFVFKVDFPDGQVQTAYLRVETSSSSLIVPSLWTETAFNNHRAHEYAFFGLYFGLVLAVLLLNFFQGLWRTERVYRAFLAYLFVTCLFHFGLTGFAAELLLPHHPVLADHWVSFGVLLNLVVGAWLYPAVLDIDAQQTPRLHRLMRVNQIVLLLSLPAPFIGYFTEVISPLMMLSQAMIAIGFVRGLQLWWQNRPGSRFVLLAVGGSLMNGCVVLLSLLGLISENFSVLYGPQLTVMLVVWALNQALGERMRARERLHQVTEQRAALAEQLADREKAARREQSRLVALLSHEIKTPLAMIRGAMHTLRRVQTSNDEIAVTRLTRIEKGVLQIDGLTGQFLEQDRIDDENLRLNVTRIDLAQLCREIIATSPSPERIQLADTSATIEADANLLNVALTNLIGNGLKYTPEHSMVEVIIQPQSKGVCITVADRGPGVPHDLKDKIFQRYVRGAHHGHIAGSGLGLNLVHEIARRHGGTIVFNPRSGGGAEFNLTLPDQIIAPT